MTDASELSGALARARAAGQAGEAARQQMMEHARDRQQAIADAHRHASVRRIAAELDCSPTVVQAALRAAKRPRS